MSRERRKAYEKQFALEVDDPFPYLLAEKLGMTVAELQARMGYDEYVRWRAFWSWRNWKQNFEQDKAAAKQRRR